MRLLAVLSALLLVGTAYAFITPHLGGVGRGRAVGISPRRSVTTSTGRLKMVQTPPVPRETSVSKDKQGQEAEMPGLCAVDDLEEIKYLEMILKAKVYDVAVQTPLTLMSRLSERIGNDILVKREDMQPVFSFKLRGAYNMIANLPRSDLDKGIITASAGNHAQGVAMSAKHLNCRAIIVMPTVTPDIKVSSVKRLGAEVVLVGDTFDEASAYAKERASKEGLPYIPPFDHPLVIAGQGTVGMELLRQTQDLKAIFVPVGGGGLIAGIAAYTKRLNPEIRVIGVEPTGANALYLSMKEGKRVTLDKVDTFADGVAVKVVGEETFRLCQKLVDEVVLVDTDEICTAIKDVFEDTRSITEPSGALAVAGSKKWLQDNGLKGQKVVAIASGANMNFDRLRLVAERAGTGSKSEAMLASFIPEVKGSFRNFVYTLSQAGVSRATGPRSITEFKYRCNSQASAKNGGRATIFYSVETESRADSEKLVKELSDAGLETFDLTKNDLSKDHVRFLAGGHAETGQEELYRFEFPERPGALRKFLDTIGDEWNISLFHYRSQGTFTGHVLVGISPLTGAEKERFEKKVEVLGWPTTCETNNVAAQMFL